MNLGLWSLDDAHEAVASFDISGFHMFFDAHHFPFMNTPGDVVADDGELDWTALLHNVPTAVLAHELAHAMQVATTPAGLMDFFLPFVAEDLAARAINDARNLVTDELPRGLRALFATSPEPTLPYRQAEAFEWYRATRLGGVKLPLSETITLDDLTRRYPDHQFSARVDRDGSTTMTLIGVRHIYEGFGGAVQRLRAIQSNEDPPDLPFDPYSVYFASYKRVRPDIDGLKGSLHEFAVLLDTALLEDEFENEDPYKRRPSTIAFQLIEVLERNPGTSLMSTDWQDVAAFQNELMRLTDFAVPDVRATFDALRARLPTVFDEIGSLTTLPRNVLADYRKCIETLQQFRLEYFNGACPLELLTEGSRSWLSALISNMPTGSNGFEPPLTEGDRDHHRAFEYQKSRHWRPVLDELVFGPRNCMAEPNCLLPRRAACAGVTHDLARQEERCSREALIAQMMSDLDIRRLI